MKKLFCFLLYVLILQNAAVAQEVTVKSLVLAQTDLTAQTEGRKDLNGDACALVKISFVGDVLDVEGNVIKPLVKRNNETWAFMTQESQQMKVVTKDALPLMVTFGNYGIDKLLSNRTYILTLNQVGVSVARPLNSDSIITIPVKDAVSIEMIKVEAGSFNMGATPEMKEPYSNEGPVHRVTLTNNYYIGKYEVTQLLWETVMGNNPSKFKGNFLPVENVSWNDCQEFISRLNLMTGKQFRLPSEAEWEYAARGGNKSHGYQYSGSNTLGDVAWYGGSKTHVVGTKQPNELGIYDMSGNVWEWCFDWYGNYSTSSQTNPIGAVAGTGRVHRGGCWYDIFAEHCRSSTRCQYKPDGREEGIGLRLAIFE